MQFTIDVSDPVKLAGLARALEQYNAKNPTKTQAEFLQWQVDGQLDEYARSLVQRIITKLTFLNRFTAEERIQVRTAAQANAAIADYLAMHDAAQEIDLTDPRTVAGVQALESAGLIAAGRAAEILAL